MRLATSRFHAADGIKQSGLLPVAVSIGTPKWALTYPLVADSRVRGMTAPWSLLHLNLSEDEFRARYEARLNRHGPDKIIAALEMLASAHDAPGCVLLCWEDLAKTWCHRRLLAEWLERQSGVEVPELDSSRGVC
jgi:hypothetical protein